MIRAKGIHKSYGDLHILKGVDLEIKKGEVVSIVKLPNLSDPVQAGAVVQLAA